MIDIKDLRKNPERYIHELRGRCSPTLIETVLRNDKLTREAIEKANDARSRAKMLKGDEAREYRSVVRHLDHLAESHDLMRQNKLLSIPNVPAPDTPEGDSEEDNIEVYRWGEGRTDQVTPHHQMNGIEIEKGVALSGSRFSVLMGDAARLHRLLGQAMIEHQLKDRIEVNVPVITNQDALVGTGQLPKFEEDLYSLLDTDAQYLIPTAEVMLTNLHRESKVTQTHRYVSETLCFRKEAGSAGRDTRGLMRQHQFNKVEMVTVTNNPEGEFELMVESVKDLMMKLELPFRIVHLCRGDMGFSARKTYDVEVWVPSQQRYREISSISDCGDFQGRRMKTKTDNGFAHTFNGSGVAVGRALIAVMENHQKDGELCLPNTVKDFLRW